MTLDLTALEAAITHAEQIEDPAPGISYGGHVIVFADVRAAIAAARERDALREALEECADDLESELRARYDWTLDRPAMKIIFDRDMASVIRARAALAKGNAS